MSILTKSVTIRSPNLDSRRIYRRCIKSLTVNLGTLHSNVCIHIPKSLFLLSPPPSTSSTVVSTRFLILLDGSGTPTVGRTANKTEKRLTCWPHTSTEMQSIVLHAVVTRFVYVCFYTKGVRFVQRVCSVDTVPYRSLSSVSGGPWSKRVTNLVRGTRYIYIRNPLMEVNVT